MEVCKICNEFFILWWSQSKSTLYTWNDLFRPAFGKDIQVLQGNQNTLNVAKHGGQAEAEEHDEE